MVHNSTARSHSLNSFILDEVIENKQAFEVSDVKRDGSVFVRFRSVTEACATACAKSFKEALENYGFNYTQTDDNKFRLPLEQF